MTKQVNQEIRSKQVAQQMKILKENVLPAEATENVKVAIATMENVPCVAEQDMRWMANISLIVPGAIVADVLHVMGVASATIVMAEDIFIKQLSIP